MKSFRQFAITLSLLLAASIAWGAEFVVDFEYLTLAPESFNNGDPGGTGDVTNNGSFVSGGITFPNEFSRSGPFTFWNGWSYSNVTDNTTAGFGNQYSAFAGSGADGSANYGVSFGDFADNSITIPAGTSFQSIDITNTTYAALSMQNGDGFAKQFGGVTGNDPDFFRLIITGLSGGSGGTMVGDVEFYLADYRFADNSLDYIVDDWTTVDLTSLVGADTLTFSYESSDVGTFGVNTPQFFAADNLVFGSASVPEPASIVGMLICGAVALIAVRFTRKRTRRVV